MTGAMKNAFGGLLDRKRHWTHSVIHETLVDLLMIQKEVHSGIFAVMDASVVGDGPGPRCMEIKEGGYMLASADQVAIDAVASKMMGFDPMELRFIRLAHEKGEAQAERLETWIFANQLTLSAAGIKQSARELAGVQDFDARYPAVLQQVRADAQLGGMLAVRATPTFFINGVRIDGGLAGPVFDAIIAHELKKAGK
jgi:hypothetical protein